MLDIKSAENCLRGSGERGWSRPLVKEYRTKDSSKRGVDLGGCERTRSVFWEIRSKETLLPKADRCVYVLRDALCFTLGTLG
eukprot:1172682-Prorocentrum_minimum.AAC.1